MPLLLWFVALDYSVLLKKVGETNEEKWNWAEKQVACEAGRTPIVCMVKPSGSAWQPPTKQRLCVPSTDREWWNDVMVTMHPICLTSNIHDTLCIHQMWGLERGLKSAPLGDPILASKILCTRNAESMAVHQAYWWGPANGQVDFPRGLPLVNHWPRHPLSAVLPCSDLNSDHYNHAT